ncbi:hypothetical protein EW146_g36 [Bondarzewia mesenterica]|uniref:RBR-type E3 ubiquitin transferase n=1 Tax=Bondarzewia mesenterica TaxID=1095465 RepID=A0A4S4M890_9AGAM|nr:hypothetical protein EW146_g36 [Bondarzewia mesenterica]
MTDSIAECTIIQEEEWQVLESIYPDCISSNLSDGIKKLEIPVELGDSRTVSIIDDGTINGISAQRAEDQPMSLSMLPPVLLHIILPPTYPLSTPPEIISLHVTNSWLTCGRHLQQELLEMWQPGEGVLYNWIEWIRTADFLRSLNFVDEHTIRIPHSSPHLLAPLLTAYDTSAKSSRFAQSAYTCAVCLTSQKGARCLLLLCGHVFCRSCLEDYWKLFIAEGDVARVGCPDPECIKESREANEEEVRRVVTEDEVMRWKWLRRKRILERDPSTVYCPVSLCQTPVSKPKFTDDQNVGWERLRTCPNCEYVFCSFCKRTWHGPLNDCPIPIAEKFIMEYMSLPEDSPSRLVLEQRYGRANINRLVAKYREDQANRQWLESSTMACPGCQVKVEKSVGCNHMTCAKCKQHFCYRCGAKLNAGDPRLCTILFAMDIYTTAFSYPRRSRHIHSSSSTLEFPTHAQPDVYPPAHFQQLSSNGHLDSHVTPSPSDTDAVQKLAMMAMATQGCHVSFSVADQGTGWNFCISGSYQQVLFARGMILKDCPIQNRASIKVARSEVLDFPSSKPALKPEVRRRLDEIASQTLAHIAVVNSPLSLSTRTPPDGISSSAGWSGLETERVCELVITGPGDSVEVARVRLLVMLDELSGLHAEVCEIDQKLQAIVAGRKRNMLQSIQEETATNIYYPSPLHGLVGPDIANMTATPSTPGKAPRLNKNVVWITGEFFGVQRARDMLLQVSLNKSKGIISRDTAILPRKLDWMVTEHADDLKSIMNDNATFIHFPPIGSSTSLITVYGDHRVNIQRTIRSVMQLACQFYVASFWLLPTQFNVLLPPSTLNATQVTSIIKQVSNATGAEVVFKGMCFEMHGLEHEVRNAVNMILELDIVKVFHHEIRFQIELANEHREFISGKKNGKINKIMQTTNVKIKFETFNDHNFLIDIAGNDGSVIQGLSLLQEELPAEISFHVPESYHKRIIGVGGRSIQRIMKKYGVYVKFSNAEEFAALGGYNDNEDNVVARTPAKNAINLDNLKQSVMELVNPKDKDFLNETVAVPRKYHRTLLGEKSIFIHDIENKTNSRVRFPDKETASDIIVIFGPESQIQIAATMLLDHVPFEADMAVPPQAELPLICSSPEFNAFVEQIKRDLQVVISPNIKTLGSGAETPADCSFKFRCQRSNSDFLVSAREMLEQFLLNHNIHVYPSPTAHTHKRGDSFAEAFPHFDSKVLSTMPRTRGSADLSRPEPMMDRRLRLANSSPDVKALFNNSPSYIYHLEEAQENLDSQSSYAPPVNDYWNPQPPIGRHGRFLSMSHVADDHSPASGLLSHMRHADNGLKRSSDSLFEANMKEQISKARSLQNRAQSLDLTLSLSRITESSSRLGPPDSPTNSIGDTGPSSSPNSATAPSFPSVYGPPSTRPPVAPNNHHTLRRTGRILDDESVDEVSRVISNLGL